MGQSEILKFLRSDPNNWFYASEIADGTKITKSSIQKALRKLVKSGDVLRKEFPFSTSGKTPFLYKLKELLD